MNLSTRLLRWTATSTGRRTLFAIATVAIIVMATSPVLLPLLPAVDAVGLDVMAVLLGAQIMNAMPWLRNCAKASFRIARSFLTEAGWFLLSS